MRSLRGDCNQVLSLVYISKRVLSFFSRNGENIVHWLHCIILTISNMLLFFLSNKGFSRNGEKPEFLPWFLRQLVKLLRLTEASLSHRRFQPEILKLTYIQKKIHRTPVQHNSGIYTRGNLKSEKMRSMEWKLLPYFSLDLCFVFLKSLLAAPDSEFWVGWSRIWLNLMRFRQAWSTGSPRVGGSVNYELVLLFIIICYYYYLLLLFIIIIIIYYYNFI